MKWFYICAADFFTTNFCCQIGWCSIFCCQKLWMAAAIFPSSTEDGDCHIKISQRWPVEISLYIRLKSFSDLETQKYVGLPVWRSHGRQRGRGFTTFQKLLLLEALRSFAVHFDHIVIDHNNLVFLTPTSSPQPPGPSPPLQFDIQVLIRLNMGEDVNQKHYPRLVLSETYLSFYKSER